MWPPLLSFSDVAHDKLTILWPKLVLKFKFVDYWPIKFCYKKEFQKLTFKLLIKFVSQHAHMQSRPRKQFKQLPYIMSLSRKEILCNEKCDLFIV